MSDALASSRTLKTGFSSLLAAAALAASLAAHGALLPRDIDGDGVVDAYYDTAQNITWLADWNASGQLLTWNQAVAWATSLDVHGVTGWRLPSISDTGNPGCDFNVAGGTDCGYNVDTRTSELARLWYVTLGNLAFCARGDASCDLQGAGEPGWGLGNTGPFHNMQSGSYWSGTEYAPDKSEAWSFATDDGSQDSETKASAFHAVAVHAGDVAPAPVGYRYFLLSPPVSSRQVQALGASGGQVVGSATKGFFPHAILWTHNGAVDLHPIGFLSSSARGVAAGQQVGYANSNGGSHAMLWKGSAASAVDLTPAGFASAAAFGADLTQQVGQGQGHALLWTGSAASAVDLHPAGFTSSGALGAGDGQQAGSGSSALDGHPHALLWTGSAASVVDLHPAGFGSSQATGVAGGQQVGFADDGKGIRHALLWTGSAASAVDLTPPGSTGSQVNAVAGGQQAGVTNGRAMVWTGSAQSAVSLHDFLGNAFTSSVAAGIDDAGNIVGYSAGNVGFPRPFTALLWRPVLPYGLDITATASPDPIHVGDQVTYTITVTNGRSGTATGVHIYDAPLSVGTTPVSAATDQGTCSIPGTVTCDLGALPGGGSAHITVVAQIPERFWNAFVDNHASAWADDLMVTSFDVATPVVGADLGVTATDAPDPVALGKNLTYTITVTNAGPSAATGVMVQDGLPIPVNLVSATSTQGSCSGSHPDILCNLGTLPSGASALVTIVVTPTQGGTISNIVNVSGNEPDPNADNDGTHLDTSVTGGSRHHGHKHK